MIAYLVTNIINGKQYVGITVKTLNQRWVEHVSRAEGRSEKYALHRAIVKYGVDAFRLSELYHSLKSDYEELKEVEKYLITSFNSLAPNGYNITKGGDGFLGAKHSSETIEKIRLLKKGTVTSPETKEKLRKAITGLKRPPEFGQAVRKRRLGKKASPEAIANMSLSHLGSKHTPETKRKMSETRTGRKLPIEWRQAQSRGSKERRLREFLKTVAWG